ncbi:MAG: galactose-1-phosphate uridylyltransferase [Acidobacteria bacterium]|nr:galactose-1-phosphate uridylyltransferase [Acidobacteriota bacterium]
MKIVEHLITGDPILVAPERSARPHAFGPDEAEPVCPFCPGHESLTPPEIVRIERDGAWIVRVFANKYPAADVHEVIVESPRHDATFDQLADASAVVRVWVERYRALAAAPLAKYVSLFKNHGPAAGASIQHLHSQIVALPFTPPRIAHEAAAFARAEGHCPLCESLDEHRRQGLVLSENESFAWIAPATSRMANEQWLLPKRHQHELASLTDAEIADLASLLQASAKATRELAPSFNWLFMNFPRERAGHFYIEAFPRRTTIAGFELATGTIIENIEPADTARAMTRRAD